MRDFFFHEYCSTIQGLLDWFEVDLGFTELSFIQIDLCVLCVFVLYSRVSLSSCPFWQSALPPPRGGSASRVSPQSCQSHESLWGSWSCRRCALPVACMYVYARTYVNTYVYTCVYSYLELYTCTYIYLYIYIYIYIYIYVHICAYTPVDSVSPRMPLAYKYLFARTYVTLHVHAFVYSYINIYVHTYTCRPVASVSPRMPLA